MKQIFINLPVVDLEKSKEFYAHLGFTNYPIFTAKNQVCMMWSETILVMLQSKAFFNLGNKKQLADVSKSISATFTLPVESITRMNEIVDTALNYGSREILPLIDEGFMQVRTIEDLDGHIWAFIYLDMDKFKEIKQ